MLWQGMTVHGRKSWAARKAAGGTRHSLTPSSTLFVHYSAGQGRNIDTWKEQTATMRSIQNYHMDVQKWSDIGYHFIVFQPHGKLKRARVFKGRSLTTVPAAQAGYNTGNVAVCVVAGPGEPIKDSTVNRIKSIYKRVPCLRVKGHRDVNATSCPGDAMYGRLWDVRRAK